MNFSCNPVSVVEDEVNVEMRFVEIVDNKTEGNCGSKKNQGQ